MVGFPANTGFAWDFLEGLYARVANRLDSFGTRTYVAYPEVGSPPRALSGSTAVPVELDATLATADSVRSTVRFVDEYCVRALFQIDQPSFNRAFRTIRRAGVDRIVVYDHTSGTRTLPRGAKRAAKALSRKIRTCVADEVLTVSDYVARRQIDIGMIPPDRVRTVHNGLPVPAPDPNAGMRLREVLGLAANRLVIGAGTRAAPEKGIEHLLRAFDLACAEWADPPALVFFGDGPDLERLRELAEELPSREHMLLPGYREHAGDLLEGADVCVTPSVWQDALPLSVLGAMARGRVVIASRVGGIPEMIEDGVTGVLVPPGDEAALAAALVEIIAEPDRRARMGAAARARVATRFRPESQIDQMVDAVQGALVTN